MVADRGPPRTPALGVMVSRNDGIRRRHDAFVPSTEVRLARIVQDTGGGVPRSFRGPLTMPSHPRSRPSGGPARHRGRDQPGRRAVLRRGSRARGTLLQDGRGRAADGTPVCAQTASTSGCPNGARPSPRDVVGGPNATAGRARSTRAEPAPRAHRRRPALRAPSPRGRHVPSPPRAIGARLERLQDGAPVSGGLTRRELGVLRLVADGLSTPQIATRLGIGPSTARNHVTRILRS